MKDYYDPRHFKERGIYTNKNKEKIKVLPLRFKKQYNIIHCNC